MNRQVVLALQTSSSPIFNQVGFDKKKWTQTKWIKRLVDWVLSLFIKPHIETTVTYQRVEIKLDNLIDYIFKHAENIRQFYNVRPKFCLMGYNQFSEISSDIRANHYFSFQVPHDFSTRVNPPSMRYQFAGMVVIVIPWMDGILMLPDLENL